MVHDAQAVAPQETPALDEAMAARIARMAAAKNSHAEAMKRAAVLAAEVHAQREKTDR